MDLFVITYYGVICGALSYISPKFGTRMRRILLGVVVGLIAASLLPIVRSTTGL